MPLKDQNEDPTTALDITRIEQTYNELFKEVTKLEKDNIVHKTNCKFCTHPIRRQAETKWESVCGSFAPVKKLFETWEKDHPDFAPMNLQNIRTHLRLHYAKQEEKLWLSEYIKDCRAYMNHKISESRRFEMLRAVIEKQLFQVASNPTLDPIKQSDQLVKMGKMLLDIIECQARLRGDLKPVNVITDKFMNVWLHVINKQSDARVKYHLQQALDEFQEYVGEGIVLEEQ